MRAQSAPCWNPAAECMPRERLAEVQLARLQAQVARAARVPAYAARLQTAGLTAADVTTLADLERFPLLAKDDLREAYPFGFAAVSMDDIVRVHATSGTTGKLTVSPYTSGDVDLWAEVMARTLTAAGVTSQDVLHNAYGYGLFTGGIGLDLGARRVGCTVVPASSGLTARQLLLIEDFGATVLSCTPSYALVLAEEAEAAGVDLRSRARLRVGLFGAEPWTDGLRRDIESRWGLEAFDIYGLAEIIGPGVAAECGEHAGLHLNEDHFLPEIIDPDTLRPAPDGATGELVLTALSREALPLIRYRTRDRVSLDMGPCACGRTFARISRIRGRTDDMIIVRGVNVFPSQIEAELVRIEGLAPHYQLRLDRPRHRLDELHVVVEATRDAHAAGESVRARLQHETTTRLRDALGISVTVTILEPLALERSLGKAVRVVERP